MQFSPRKRSLRHAEPALGMTALNSGFSFPDIQRLMAYGQDKPSKETEPTPSQGGQELEAIGLLPTVSVTPPNGIDLRLLLQPTGSCAWNLGEVGAR